MVFTEVIGAEFGNAVLFGQVHQITVDTYAVQHAGGPHPDKSMAVHLAGMYLVQEQGVPPTRVPKLLQQLVSRAESWPHFPPPADRGRLTIFDVAMAVGLEGHIGAAREWGASVWRSWQHHAEVAAFVSRHLPDCGAFFFAPSGLGAS